jgi:ATP-dependent Clp protease ATP-binding subunit ClpX
MKSIGYSAKKAEDQLDETNILQYIIPKDLKDFGLIPEIIGRLPVLTHMNPLDAEALRAILTEPKNAIIKQYEKLFKMDDVSFTITDQALDYIVEKAIEYKLGARGLRSLCEAIFTDAMFSLPSSDEKELKVTKSYAEKMLSFDTIKKLKAVS